MILREVVVVEAVRTPVGRFTGGLSSLSASDLGARAIAGLLERTGLDPAEVDHVIMGCTLQFGENTYLSRLAAFKAGIPHQVPALTVNRLCGSGLEAINEAARLIQLGLADTCVAGGAESMSNGPYFSTHLRGGARLGHVPFTDGVVALLTDPMLDVHMGITAENLAEKYDISRRDQDCFAAGSHRKAVKAMENGKFTSQIVPVEISSRKQTSVVDKDEGPRADASMESMSKLKPAFKPDGTVTAGNASSINDAASAVLVMEKEKAKALGLKPRCVIMSQAVVGVDPEYMGIGPVFAIPGALKSAGLDLKDIGVIELNEAFAAQSLAVLRELRIDLDKVNTNGGAIALGHPIGATGSIVFTKAFHELEQRGEEFGLVSLCIGGGQGIATVIRSI
ncbi:MAG: thiolase family protein [Thermovirgaceae bacterium]|nr:thiolase family protein [Thermovirgaceae bacterium]